MPTKVKKKPKDKNKRKPSPDDILDVTLRVRIDEDIQIELSRAELSALKKRYPQGSIPIWEVPIDDILYDIDGNVDIADVFDGND